VSAAGDAVRAEAAHLRVLDDVEPDAPEGGPVFPEDLERFDPDEVARAHGEEPPADGSGALPALRADAFLELELPPPAWIAEDIVPERAIGIIGGAPKVFKSTILEDLAISIAWGGRFLGRFDCGRARRVLLYQTESARAAFQRRLRARSRRYGGAPAELFVVTNEPVVFEDRVSFGRLEVTIAQLRPEAVFLDNLASLTTADENSAQEIGAVVRQLRALRDRYDCAVGLVHHTNKGGSARPGDTVRSGLKLRGSSALYAAVEWALWVERPDDAAARVEVRVEQKESEARRPFVVELDAAGELRVAADEISVTVTDDDLLEAVVARARRATPQQLSADLGMPERTVRERMTYLVQHRRAFIEEGSGRGRKPLVYVVTKTSVAGPRLLSAPE